MHASDRPQRFDRLGSGCGGLTEANPNIAIRLDGGVNPRPRRARRHISRMRRDLLAVAIRSERPAMIGANQAVILDRAKPHPHSAGGTPVPPTPDPATFRAPRHETLAVQKQRHITAPFEILRRRNGIPRPWVSGPERYGRLS